jgi:hypothetical protein
MKLDNMLRMILENELKENIKELKPDMGLEPEEFLKGYIAALKRVINLIRILQNRELLK